MIRLSCCCYLNYYYYYYCCCCLKAWKANRLKACARYSIFYYSSRCYSMPKARVTSCLGLISCRFRFGVAVCSCCCWARSGCSAFYLCSLNCWLCCSGSSWYYCCIGSRLMSLLIYSWWLAVVLDDYACWLIRNHNRIAI